MAFLKPDKVKTVKWGSNVLTIKQRIIPNTAVASKYVADWCQKGWKMKPCALLANDGRARGIVVHNSNSIKATKGTTMSEQYSRSTYPNCNMGGVVVHYYVSPEEIWQNLDLTEQGWHAADGSMRHKAHNGASYTTIGGNLDCIAIEIIGPESEENGAKLVAYLMYKLKLTINDVYTHNYFIHYKVGLPPADAFIPAKYNSYKQCPIYILDHWSAFLEKVKGYYDEIVRLENEAASDKTDSSSSSSTSSTSGTASTSSTKKTLYKVQVGSFLNKNNATNLQNVLKNTGYSGAYIATYKKEDITYYRVQVGAFSTREAAEKYGEPIKKRGYQVQIIIE